MSSHKLSVSTLGTVWIVNLQLTKSSSWRTKTQMQHSRLHQEFHSSRYVCLGYYINFLKYVANTDNLRAFPDQLKRHLKTTHKPDALPVDLYPPFPIIESVS
jgi:hypothetical protein